MDHNIIIDGGFWDIEITPDGLEFDILLDECSNGDDCIGRKGFNRPRVTMPYAEAQRISTMLWALQGMRTPDAITATTRTIHRAVEDLRKTLVPRPCGTCKAVGKTTEPPQPHGCTTKE